MKKLHEILEIVGKKNSFFLILLFFSLIILSFLEFIGLGSIPIYVSLILDPDNILNKINNPELVKFLKIHLV